MRDTVFLLFSDCIPVRGAARSAIYDLGRRKIVSFASSYFHLIGALNGHPLSAAIATLATEAERVRLKNLAAYLVAHELGTWTDDATPFPPIRRTSTAVATIQNSIVDVRTRRHDFVQLFAELDALGCEFVQLRAYTTLLSLAELDAIAASAEHKTIRGLEILIPYCGISYPEEGLRQLVLRRRIICKLIVHGAPADQTVAAHADDVPGSATQRFVHFIQQRIPDATHCGRIASHTLAVPSMRLFAELQEHNGCLNRKIAIDEDGEIKNCPSMQRSFGHFGTDTLARAAASPELRLPWHIAKDQIEVCRDCEFRYVCTDCRAHVMDTGNPNSKPAKCGYDPYRGRWEDPARVASTTAGHALSAF